MSAPRTLPSSLLDFERHRLANGLTLLMAPDRTLPIVALNLWYRVGSGDEGAGESGLAHLFEHMMFQGSLHLPKGAHMRLVEEAGGSLNATTWFDRTNYFETLPSHELALALWLESDRMGWLLPALGPETFENQRDVVRNERRQRVEHRPYGDAEERILSRIFPPGHPYHHPVIGWMEDLDAVTLDMARAFAERSYTPARAILTLAGDLEPESTLREVERYFADIPASPPVPPQRSIPPLPPLAGSAERVLGAVPLPRSYLAFRVPPLTDPDFPVVSAMSALLGDGRSSRLFQRLVRGARLAKDGGSHLYPLVRGVSLWTSWLTGFPTTEPELLEGALLREVEGLASVSASELDRVVRRAEVNLLRQLEPIASRANLLSTYEAHFGNAARLGEELERIREVTPRRIRAMAERILLPENRVLLTYSRGAGDA